MSAARPLRRDAADNHERLLRAAATVFARDGVDACIEQVAREAGVGMGTVYRHFPTKQALIGQLGDVLLGDLADLAEAAHRDEAADPGGASGLERYLRAAGRLLAERRGYVAVIWSGYRAAPRLERLRAAVGRLLTAAQDEGTVSPDVTATDIAAVLWALRGVMEATNAVAPDAWMRHLDFALAGLATSGIGFSAEPLATEQIGSVDQLPPG